ncbi:TfuA-like protein [Aestuariispira insulae]|uniref:TfuA-like core domain-containing protein n=1 Tax=Aestuariispira insulae TaxID=1461337 RepID=A0A3D9H1J3_9PROT|nr:TfuA-like protein [Aestuariispira insulae]RED43370.1 hypothetical protein DFP90_12313 [Aestuariispira insulae]
MTVAVFLGPSLPENEARSILDVNYLPPVSQGDVYRAVSEGAKVVAVIDGYFERIPAVWHKEILWAMKQGVHVYGASSMGALRAAELAPFGMKGVGEIFHAFAEGRLFDDDEVTIAHGPKELGYPATSDAMVNIRATLDRAVDAAIVTPKIRDLLIERAKGTYYPLRNYEDLLDFLETHDADAAAALACWLPEGRIDAKKADAKALLQEVRNALEQGLSPFEAGYHFEHTDAWEQASKKAGRQIAAAIPEELPMDVILEELRLDGAAYAKTMGVALSRSLALREAERQGATIDRERFRSVLNNFFVQRGRKTPEAIAEWMREQDVDSTKLTELIQRELKVGLVETLFRDDIIAQIPDSLRVGGIYGAVVRRAMEKRQWLQVNGYENVRVESCGVDEGTLLGWHFGGRHQMDIPGDLDGYAQSIGLGNRFDFLQALARDYLFEHR